MNSVRQGILFCVVGPTASGKTTVVDGLLAQTPPGISRSISTTTRSPRANEVAGVSYDFVSTEQFEKLKANNEFFESETIHGKSYGTRKSALESAGTRGHDLILTIDIRGALNVKKCYPRNTVITFIVPPSSTELLRRINSRGVDDHKQVQRRLETAKEEYQMLFSVSKEPDLVDYFIINDKLADATTQLRSIVEAERLRFSRINAEHWSSICSLDNH